MRLRFLGTGTSAGVPVIGCDCAVCTSDDPRDNRLRTSATLEFTDPTGQDRVILIDAGPDLRQQVLRAGIERIDAILFTHNHVDHTFGLDEVRRFNVVMGEPIDIYADAHTLEHLRRVYRHIFDRQKNIQQSFVATLIAHEIRAFEPFDLFGLRITPIRLLHGRLPVLGFRFDPTPSLERAVRGPGRGGDAEPILPLAYCTDVSAIPPESWEPLSGVRTLVLDALRHRKHPTHFTLGQAVGVAQRINPDRTLFVHMTHDLGHESSCSEVPEGMQLAHDGLVIGNLDGNGAKG